MITDYKQILLRIGHDIGAPFLNLYFKNGDSKKCVVNFDGCKILNKTGKKFSLYGKGQTPEEAYEDYFYKLQGKTLIWQEIDSLKMSQANFDEAFNKYKERLKEEYSKYPTYKEYEKILNNEDSTVTTIRINNIKILTINGKYLYVLMAHNEVKRYLVYTKDKLKIMPRDTLTVWKADYSDNFNLISKIKVV